MSVKVVEFYSGIGGIHLALEVSGMEFSVVAAFDINTTANAVYRHNFPNLPLRQKNIQGLKVEELEKLGGDVWTMSPPCQPFTRRGKGLDLQDNRTSSFLRILEILSTMESPPKFLFLENVKGFETSETHQKLAQTLSSRNYRWKEYLLNPNQLGIPNSRFRFYLLATRTEAEVGEEGCENSEILLQFPPPSCSCVLERMSRLPESAQIIAGYLCASESEREELLLGKAVLGRQAEVLDVVTPAQCGSCCFTRAYGHYAEGTGSVLFEGDWAQLDEAYAKARSATSTEEKVEWLKKLRLRYFSPKEMANLMGFPPKFEFPSDLSRKQLSRVVGNSVSVLVVSRLLHHFLCTAHNI
jgi:tRNA (cytosine38-C5)-methyltransferase